MDEIRMSAEVLDSYHEPDAEKADDWLKKETETFAPKIVVLDDDPTGVQTVHDVSVYTDWSLKHIRQGFLEKNRLFFILTNSRGFTEEQTIRAHREIAANVDAAAKESGMEYLIVNRSDSTLRGHFPLETAVLREELEAKNDWKVDAEILCPYFREGGRYTLENVHYVRYGQELVPAAGTEFAKDETFGYTASNLCEYVEEKTKGAFKKEDCVCIPLEMLRALDIDAVEAVLMNTGNYNKIIVNAADDADVKVFAAALYRTMRKGRHYTVRCAAAFVKALGNISDKPLLGRNEMVRLQSGNGGIIVVGSHTEKTTAQLAELKMLDGITFIELNSDLVLEPEKLEQEVEMVLKREEALLASGRTVCISTKRTLLKVAHDTPEEALLRSVKISEALQNCVGKLKTTPAFVVAKGGITSSDVGTKGLRVKRAQVLGQIEPGIPVWQTGAESLFPGTPYVIFPGNVGEVDTLRKAVEKLL